MYEFLVRVNSKFEGRSRIMGTRPTLREAFNTVKFEESRKFLAQGVAMNLEPSALAARGAPADSRG